MPPFSPSQPPPGITGPMPSMLQSYSLLSRRQADINTTSRHIHAFISAPASVVTQSLTDLGLILRYPTGDRQAPLPTGRRLTPWGTACTMLYTASLISYLAGRDINS